MTSSILETRDARSVPGFLEALRNSARSCYELRSFKNALYWADQCVTFSNGNLEDIHLKAKCLFQMGHYKLAAHLIMTDEVEDHLSEALMLAAQAYFAAQQFEDCLDVLIQLEERFPDTLEYSKAEQTKSLLSAMADISLNMDKGTGVTCVTPRLASYWVTPRGSRGLPPVAVSGSKDAGSEAKGNLPTPSCFTGSQKNDWTSFTSFGSNTPASIRPAAATNGSHADSSVLPASMDPVLPSQDYLLLSNIQLLKAKCYDALEDMVTAVTCYKLALTFDHGCVEALEELAKWKRLPRDQEQAVLDMVRSPRRVALEDAIPLEHRDCRQALLVLLYESKFDFQSSAETPQLTKNGKSSVIRFRFRDKLVEDFNPTAMVNEATRLFNQCEVHEALQVSSRILDREPFNLDALPIHIACLVETGSSMELFKLGHQLTEAFPEEPVSWFAAACYNFITRKQDTCRRLIQKVLSRKSSFGYAWLLYGHSFAAEKEHDQANAAYFKCWQYMRGSHLPLLYIGVEYTCTNNIVLAESFFHVAAELSPEDPFVLHEMGVVAYNKKEFRRAEELFSRAYARVRIMTPGMLPKVWESLLNNHGHCYRKLGRYEEARRKHCEALLVAGPLNPVTFKALAFVCALENKGTEAIQYLSKAQSLKAGDAFVDELLKRLMEFHQKQMDYNEGMFSVPRDILDFQRPPSPALEDPMITPYRPPYMPLFLCSDTD